MDNWGLSQCLDKLAIKRRLKTIKRGISLDLELASEIRRAKDKAVLFNNITDHSFPVVNSLCGSISNLSTLAKVKNEAEFRALTRNYENISNNITLVEEAKCQEMVQFVNSNTRLDKVLPIPKFASGDAGKYITAGVVFLESALIQKVSNSEPAFAIRRLLFLENNTFVIRIDSKEVLSELKQASIICDKIPIAIAIGLHPFFLLATQCSKKLGYKNKLGFATNLLKSSCSFVKAKTNSLLVPAEAQFVLEGNLLLKRTVMEGPVGELAGYYGVGEERYVVEINCLTHQKYPVFQVIAPGNVEQYILNALVRETALYCHLQKLGCKVFDVCFSLGGCGRFHVIISIDKKTDADVFVLFEVCFAKFLDIKLLIVVDKDIDIHSSNEVEWAIATRFRADRDLKFVNKNSGSFLDPSQRSAGFSSPIALDATIPVDEKNNFQVVFA